MIDQDTFHANSHRENQEAFAAACERYYEESFGPRVEVSWNNPLPPDLAAKMRAEFTFMGGDFVAGEVEL